MYKLFYLFLLAIISCNAQPKKNISKITPTFYHWKTVFAPTPFEKNTLDSLKAKTIYLRFFDVAWDEPTQSATPISKSIIKENIIDSNYNIIPTVFITDECIYKVKEESILSLAKNIVQQINILASTSISDNYKQIQIDCDWTKTSKDKYFQLLENIKELLPNKLISATIRLHQIKYSASTGVPPVSRGMLMCYNMGNLRNPNSKNSILDIEETEKYIGTLNNYPLALDIALPLFDWIVLFRDNKFKGLIQDNQKSYSGFASEKNSTIGIIQRDTILNGISFLKNDQLRFERSEYPSILKAAKLLSKKIKSDSLSVAFYHLDSLTLRKYNAYELENICSSLR